MTDQYLIERQKQKLGLAAPKEEKKPVRISMKSLKRIAEQKLYDRQKKEMLEESPFCKIKSPVCTGRAQGLDHLQKRSPKNYLKRSNLVPACNACQLFKEENPGWSIKNGTSISRFKKEENL